MTTRFQVFPTINVNQYKPHVLHTEACAWVEKNCYIDLFIELLHAQGLEPLAMLPFTLSVNFEGDQWTFYKPQHSELRALYGINVQEMSVWKPLLNHATEHLSAGRLIAVEVDSFWLPDTSGSDYRQQHVKTTIALADIDVPNQRLGYFHNAGFFELSGEDFRQIFRIEQPVAADNLHLYAELIHLNRSIHQTQAALVKQSYALLQHYVGLRPQDNPIRRFGQHFTSELNVMQAQGLPYYHAWAFCNTRQLGSAFELAAANLAWLEKAGIAGLTTAQINFTEIANTNKSLILKVARAVHSGKQVDLQPLFEQMAEAWDNGMNALDNTLT